MIRETSSQRKAAERGDAVAGGNQESGRSVISRALALLAAFDAGQPELSSSELARRSGLPLSTTHRMVAELVDWQGLARSEDGHYEIGRRIWAWACSPTRSASCGRRRFPFCRIWLQSPMRTCTSRSAKACRCCTSTASPGVRR